MIERAKENGLTVTRSCVFWRINRRRITKWRTRRQNGQSLKDLKPGPRQPVHRLLPEEKEAALMMAKNEYADLSHRLLTVTAWDLNIFFLSFSSAYRILRFENLMTMRKIQRQHNNRSIPPVRK